MVSAAALARAWINAWNNRDLQGVLGHYDPEVVFCSPRVAAAWEKTKGTDAPVGSPDGRLLGVEQLRLYFAEGLKSLSDLKMTLLHVAEAGPGQAAVVYTRETGAVVVECMTFRPEAAHATVTHVQVYYDTVC